MGRQVLIDGDIVAYRCGFACEHKLYHAIIDGKEMTFKSKTDLNQYIKDFEPAEYEYTSELLIEPLSFALSTVKHMLDNIQELAKAGERIIYLSDPAGNFRSDVATILKYKGNRDQQRKPLYIDEIHAYLRTQKGALSMPNLEADDLLADTQTTATAAGRDTVIASIDKDLLQIPGKHLNFVTGDRWNISEDTAYRNKMCQILTGDGTDNIPGILGIGPVKASKALADAKSRDEMWDVIFAMWFDYLNGDKRPHWLVSFDPHTGRIVYIGWQGNTYASTLYELIKEIERLITVGVPRGETHQAPEA